MDTKKDLHEEFDLRIQGIQVEIETRTPAGTPQCKFNMQLAEFVQGLDITWHKFKTQLAEVRALAMCRSCGRGTSV